MFVFINESFEGDAGLITSKDKSLCVLSEKEQARKVDFTARKLMNRGMAQIESDSRREATTADPEQNPTRDVRIYCKNRRVLNIGISAWNGELTKAQFHALAVRKWWEMTWNWFKNQLPWIIGVTATYIFGN